MVYANRDADLLGFDRRRAKVPLPAGIGRLTLREQVAGPQLHDGSSCVVGNVIERS